LRCTNLPIVSLSLYSFVHQVQDLIKKMGDWLNSITSNHFDALYIVLSFYHFMTTLLKCLILLQDTFIYILFSSFNLTITLRPSSMSLGMITSDHLKRFFALIIWWQLDDGLFIDHLVCDFFC
jgi:hypothetical protein